VASLSKPEIIICPEYNRMNRRTKMPMDLNNLMPESCFMDFKQYNSKEVKDHVVDKEAHNKTIRAMIHEAIKEQRQLGHKGKK